MLEVAGDSVKTADGKLAKDPGLALRYDLRAIKLCAEIVCSAQV